MKKIYSLFISLSRNKRNRNGLLAFAFIFLGINAANATTYYLTAAGAANTQTPANWNTNPAGGGTAATNFTTNGDVFIIPTGRAGTFSLNGIVTFAAGITLQIDESFTVDSKTTLTINGTIIFTNTTSTQVTLVGGSGSNASTININGTAKTNHA